MTVEQLLFSASERLREAGVETPRLDAELLLCKAANRTRIELLTHPDFEPTADVIGVFSAWVGRRIRREPLPYISGERPFYDLLFEVTPAVLIPRQETEFLVEAAIDILKLKQSPSVIDIGVGSGAIAVCIAEHVKDALVYGTDTSAAALQVAVRNAESHGLSPRVSFGQGDLFQPFNDLTFDLVVSNPPYIPTSDIPNLQPEVALYEPHGALDGGPDGLDVYRRIVPEAVHRLNPSGSIALEVGIGESQEVMSLCEDNGFIETRAIKDYSGIERVVTAQKPCICR